VSYLGVCLAAVAVVNLAGFVGVVAVVLFAGFVAVFSPGVIGGVAVLALASGEHGVAGPVGVAAQCGGLYTNRVLAERAPAQIVLKERAFLHLTGHEGPRKPYHTVSWR
jgi:hypothetical protein